MVGKYMIKGRYGKGSRVAYLDSKLVLGISLSRWFR